MQTNTYKKVSRIIIFFICNLFLSYQYTISQDITNKKDIDIVSLTKEEIVDFSYLLGEQEDYSKEFIQFVLDSPPVDVKVLNDWYYPKTYLSMPLFYRLKFEDMQVSILYEYEYRIVWVKYDSDKKIGKNLKALKKEVSRIMNHVSLDDNIVEPQGNTFGVLCCDDGSVTSFKYVIWNNQNYIFVTQKPVARPLAMHEFGKDPKIRKRSVGNVGLETLIDDEKRKDKLTQIIDFIPDDMRKKLQPDHLNACIMPTEKAGAIYKIATEKIMRINAPDLEEYRKTSKVYRQWESQDHKFQTMAKFVSLDKNKNRVTLEKPNGKKTVVKLHILRFEDRKYIQDALETKEKKSN